METFYNFYSRGFRKKSLKSIYFDNLSRYKSILKTEKGINQAGFKICSYHENIKIDILICEYKVLKNGGQLPITIQLVNKS